MAKDSSKFIEKPCEIGDTVYYIEMCRTAEDFGKKYIDFAKVKNILVNTAQAEFPSSKSPVPISIEYWSWVFSIKIFVKEKIIARQE